MLLIWDEVLHPKSTWQFWSTNTGNICLGLWRRIHHFGVANETKWSIAEHDDSSELLVFKVKGKHQHELFLRLQVEPVGREIRHFHLVYSVMIKVLLSGQMTASTLVIQCTSSEIFSDCAFTRKLRHPSTAAWRTFYRLQTLSPSFFRHHA